jgi:hypothetical protein
MIDAPEEDFTDDDPVSEIIAGGIWTALTVGFWLLILLFDEKSCFQLKYIAHLHLSSQGFPTV